MITFIYRFIKHSLVFLFIMLPLMIVGAIVLFPYLPFVPNSQIKLNPLFIWWDNVDSYIDRDTSAYRAICNQGWWARYVYIAWRNPVNYFDYLTMGLLWNSSAIYTKYDPSEDDIGDTTRAGLRHIEVMQDKKNYYEYYWIYQYPFKKYVCMRFRLGWKIKDKNNPPGSVSQWVFVISPWHNYSGV